MELPIFALWIQVEAPGAAEVGFKGWSQDHIPVIERLMCFCGFFGISTLFARPMQDIVA